MRPLAIGLTGFVALLLVFAVVAFLQLVLSCLALLLCGMIAVGFRWQANKKRAFWIPTTRDANVDEVDKPETTVNIEGRTFSIRNLPARLEFTEHRRNRHLIGAVAIVAIGSLFACFVSWESFWKPINPESQHYFEFYGLCYLMAILLIPALVWLSESALMRAPGVTLANVRAHSNGGLGTLWVGYQFTDRQGGYRGGSAMDFGGPKNDHLKVVFCDPINPDFNKLSCGLLFHRIRWMDEPNEATHGTV